MNYFNSRHFLNFIKNKKSIRFINQTQINKIKSVCANKIETRALVAIKNSKTVNANTIALLTNPLSLVSYLFLAKLEKLQLLDCEGKNNPLI